MRKTTTLAMILAGGRVDELNVLTLYRPKSALPFGSFVRVIDFPLSNLMRSGIERVAILSQYRSYSLINHIGTGAAWDMQGRNRSISILPPYTGSDQHDWYRGSADAVHRNLDFIKYTSPENVLVLSGDHIYKMDYQKILEYHHEKDADLTMVFIRVPLEKAHRFGLAALDDEDGERGGRVIGYWEKPEQPESDWASLTVMLFKPNVLYKFLQENQIQESFEFGRDIIPAMMAAGYRVYGYKFRGYWGYTRTIEEYWQSNMDLLGERPLIDLEAWGLRTNLDHRGIRDFQPTIVGDYAHIENSLIYNGCRIDGTVRNSIISPGVVIEKNSVVENSILFFNSHIGRNCLLSKVVADVDCRFRDGARVGAEPGASASRITVLGQDNTIPAGAFIEQGAVIYPKLSESSWKSTVAGGEVLR
ncbi:MAG: glucose-1-phosphate adenylyltransferase [Desulfobulbaceae bacterium]|jgi:glucose-1-phosphate adenylyltransferase|nr:glucose-1-phosphate adenylyltransferase [Desulfobulbaceae bacterium]